MPKSDHLLPEAVEENAKAWAQIEAWTVEITRYVENNGYYEQQAKRAGLDTYFDSLDAGRPSILSLYWSRPQVEAQQSQQMATVRSWLNRLWRWRDGGQVFFDPDKECVYADRLRWRSL